MAEAGTGSSWAGAGGQNCEPRVCDDGNDCTADLLDEECACRHEAVPDGAACDDGDVCTELDRCASGACSGEILETAPAVLGSLRSFGSGPGLSSVVAFASDDRLLFASGHTLSLVAIEGDELRALDHVDMHTTVKSENVGSMIWVARPRTWLLPVAGGRMAVVNAGYGIDLYDLTGDRFTPSERWGFDSFEGTLRAAAAFDHRIFIGVNNTIVSYRINPTTFEVTPGPRFTLPSAHTCQELAVTPDGQTLLVNTSRGLDRVDISGTDGSMSLLGTALTDLFLIDLAVTEQHVGVFQLADNFSGRGNVLILDAGTFEPVADFSFEAEERPNLTGFALLDGGRVVLQLLERDGCAVQSVELHSAVAASGNSELRSWKTLEACTTDFDVPSHHTVARGDHVVLEPTHEVVRVDPETHAATPVAGLEQGSFERVRALSGARVAVHGPGAVHLVDVEEPDAPRVIAGGLESPITTEHFRMEVTPSKAPFLLTVPDAGTAFGARTSLFWSDGVGLPKAEGSVANELEGAVWITSGAYAYELTEVGQDSLRLRRFPGVGLDRDVSQAWPSDLDQVLALEVSEELGSRTAPKLAVEPTSGRLVVLEYRRLANASSGGASLVHSFSYGEHGYEAERTLPFDSKAFDWVGAANGVTVAGDSASAVVIATEGASQELAFTDFTAFALLGFDGEKLYLSGYFPGERAFGAVVLDTLEGGELARYETPDEVRTLAFSGNHLVFGMPSGLTVASAACSTASR